MTKWPLRFPPGRSLDDCSGASSPIRCVVGHRLQCAVSSRRKSRSACHRWLSRIRHGETGGGCYSSGIPALCRPAKKVASMRARVFGTPQFPAPSRIGRPRASGRGLNSGRAPRDCQPRGFGLRRVRLPPAHCGRPARRRRQARCEATSTPAPRCAPSRTRLSPPQRPIAAGVLGRSGDKNR